MYRASDLRILAKQLGWRQNLNDQDFTIDISLTETNSGEYYQDIHPLLTLENLKAVAPDFDKITYPTWLVGTAYKLDNVVLLNGKKYIALQDNTGQDPEADDQNNPVYWDLFDPFSNWLAKKTEASVLKLISTLHSEKIANKTANNIIKNRLLFDIAGRLSDTLDNTSSLVGFEIVPLRSKGITIRIDKIGLQFSGDIEDLAVYLLHSSQNSSVRTLTLNRSKDKSLEWFVPSEELLLPYDSNSNDGGGSWFLVYDQRALSENTKAIIKDLDWSKGPCRTCSNSRLKSWNEWNQYFEIHPFKTADVVEPEGAPVMWDLATNVYTYKSNYGLNLQITVLCDTTDLILEQKSVLNTAIGLQVANDLIRTMAYNPEYNIERTQQNFDRMSLLYELDGDSQSNKKSGLAYDLDQAKKALSIDLNKLSRACYSCKNKGVRIKSI